MWLTVATFMVILSYVWLVQPRAPRELVAVPIATVAALGVWRAVREREWGFDRRAFVPAVRAAALVTVPAVLGILATGAWLGTLHDRRDFLGSLAPLIVWGGVQQWILQTVVLREAQRTTSQRWGVLLAAVLFAAVHLPNPFLTVMTLAGGLAWCAIYARYPNILPLAISHGLATLAILYAFDETITGRLRIGYSYLQLGK